MSISGAELDVRHLEAQGVRHIFGVPGAKIDCVYDALLDSPIQTVVCRPRQMVISNGQQTLGVALPWAIAACLVRPSEKVISISGDGGFHFSSVELETAVRLKSNFVHIIWRDGFYDMVRFQEELKYGRRSGVDFGPINTVRFAESMGARGFVIERAEDFAPTLRKAMELTGPVLIDVPVDYSHNKALGQQVLPQALI